MEEASSNSGPVAAPSSSRASAASAASLEGATVAEPSVAPVGSAASTSPDAAPPDKGTLHPAGLFRRRLAPGSCRSVAGDAAPRARDAALTGTLIEVMAATRICPGKAQVVRSAAECQLRNGLAGPLADKI